jgi:iron complex outermembrane receptor protein
MHHIRAALLATAALTAAPAWAQSPPPPTTAAQDGSTSSEGEIVVTARRQTERLRDVPASVTVLTAETLANTGAVRGQDFVALTPGVTIVTGTAEAGDTQINIRGQNGARDAENSVALVVDGILKTNVAQLNQPQGTLRQIEVLKGPQGAIYGRNAAAGAIVISTLKPGDAWEGAAKVSYGSVNTVEANAYVAGPLSPTLGVVLSGYYRSTDGFYRNRFLGNSKTVDDQQLGAGDFRLMYRPDDATTVDAKVRYSKLSGASIAFNAAFALPALGAAAPAFYEDVNKHPFNFYSNIRPTNDQETVDASIKIDHDFGKVKLTAWALYSNTDQSLTADGTSADFARYTFPGATPASVAASNACFRSTAALTGYPINPPGFIGQTPVPFIFAPATGSTFGPYSPTTCDGTQYQIRRQEDVSAEIRLASSAAGPLQWQAGAYYLHIDRRVGVSLGADLGQGIIQNLYNPPSSSNPTSQLFDDSFKTDVFAVFGSLDWKPTPRFQAGVALRYDNEDRHTRNNVPFVADPITGGPLNPGQAGGPIAPKQRTFDQVQPKITLRYEVADRINIYANYGIGFKSGGFNNSGSAAIVQQNFVPLGAQVSMIDTYRKETSNAVEAGVKGTVFGGKLDFDAAGYFTQVDDMQYFEFFVGSFGLLRVVSNIDQVNIYGGELNLNWRVANGVRVFGSGNITESRIERNRSRPNTIGNKSPYTADYTLNAGFEVDRPVYRDWRGVIRFDYRLTGPTWFSTVQNQTVPTLFSALLPISALQLPAAAGNANFSRTQRDAFGTINARIGIKNDRFSLAVFGTNLTNKQYLNEVIPAVEFGGSFISPSALRVIGVEVGARF